MKKIVLYSLILLPFISCVTSSNKDLFSQKEIMEKVSEITIDTLNNHLSENQYLKAIQLIHSIEEGSDHYEDIQLQYNGILDNLIARFNNTIEEKKFNDSLKYYKSLSVLGRQDRLTSWNETDLKLSYIKEMFENDHSAAAVVYLYDNLEYGKLEQKQLKELEQLLLDNRHKGALKDLFLFYKENSIPAMKETMSFIREPFNMEEMIKGTVTVWVNKGIKIENGIGIPDRGIGSGFFIDKKGYILTNYHVISSEVDPQYEGFSRLFIKLSDDSEERIPAKVIGWDKEFDIALLKTEIVPEYLFSVTKEYEPILGDKIFAIGSPGGLKNTITSGSVSALSRQLQPIGDSLQIDVPINPGNSGGPLLNSSGEVIGIIFAGIEQFEGVNFAIPVSDVKNSLPALFEGGKVIHPWIGCGLYERNNVLEVLYVFPNSPAELVGIKKGDIIESINSKEINEISQMQREILKNPIDTLVQIGGFRDGNPFQSILSLDERPDEPMEEALNSDLVDRLFVPFFGMEVERIRGSGSTNVLYSIKNVYPGMTADEAGLSNGDSVLLRKWIVDKEQNTLIIQIIMKTRKAGFIESAVQIGTYLMKGFMI